MVKKSKIYKDKWIHSLMSNNIQSPITQLDEDALVSNLIDNANHYWNKDLINQIFSPNEAKAIIAIPLCLIDWEDKLV